MPTVRDAGPERRPRHRKPRSASFPVAWILAILVVVGAGAFLMFSRGQQMSGAADINIIKERTENILSSWRDLKPKASYDKTGDSLFSPITWTITNAEVFESRGRCVVSVESSTRGGAPVRVVWEFQYRRIAGDGWTAFKMMNAQEGYINGSWKF